MKVNWDSNVCIHAGKCVGNLPEVFKIENDTLAIYPEAAEEGRLREVVAMCPSGALTIEE